MGKIAFVFPGQGSQAVGMLEGFAGNAAVQQTMEQASDILKQDLTALIANGPKEDLDLTTNTQPVMLAAGVAFYRAWLDAGGKLPDLLAGHSLGEYSALVAAGVIDFADALPLVRFRAEAMQQAVPLGVGGMAVVLGLSDEAVAEVCAQATAACPGKLVQGVNFNAPAQVVIAGHLDALEQACVLAKAAGAKRAMSLPVSAPFHSALLQPASERLAGYLQNLHFHTPQIDVINNVDVAIEREVDAIKQALVRQAASPVRWVETVRKMAAMEVSHVVECGPGRVLQGLTKRIEGSLIGEAIFNAESMHKVIEVLA